MGVPNKQAAAAPSEGGTTRGATQVLPTLTCGAQGPCVANWGRLRRYISSRTAAASRRAAEASCTKLPAPAKRFGDCGGQRAAHDGNTSPSNWPAIMHRLVVFEASSPFQGGEVKGDPEIGLALTSPPRHSPWTAQARRVLPPSLRHRRSKCQEIDGRRGP